MGEGVEDSGEEFETVSGVNGFDAEKRVDLSCKVLFFTLNFVFGFGPRLLCNLY